MNIDKQLSQYRQSSIYTKIEIERLRKDKVQNAFKSILLIYYIDLQKHINNKILILTFLQNSLN